MTHLLKSLYTFLEKQWKRLFFLPLKALLHNKPLEGKLQPQSLHRVLILRYDMIGDMVVTLPMIRYLKMIAPAMEVEVLASEKNYEVIRHDTNVTRWFIFHSSFVRKLMLIWQLRRRRYDAIFLCVLNKATAIGILANLIGGRKAYKLTSFRGEKYSHFFHWQSKLAHAQASAWDKFLYMVYDSIETDIQPWEAKPYLAIPQHSRQKAMQVLQEIPCNPKEYVLINLSCRNRRNEWTEEGYRSIVQMVLERTAYRIFILSMPNDEEKAQSLKEDSDRVHLYPPTKDILEIAAAVEYAVALLTPDTGVVHIASAVGTPTLGLYVGGTLAHTEWAPYRLKHSKVLQSYNQQYVETIPPDTVIQEFSSLLQEIKAEQSSP